VFAIPPDSTLGRRVQAAAETAHLNSFDRYRTLCF